MYSFALLLQPYKTFIFDKNVLQFVESVFSQSLITTMYTIRNRKEIIIREPGINRELQEATTLRNTSFIFECKCHIPPCELLLRHLLNPPEDHSIMGTNSAGFRGGMKKHEGLVMFRMLLLQGSGEMICQPHAYVKIHLKCPIKSFFFS